MNLFDFYIPEWFFVALNLAILVFVLRRVLWKPVNKILDERAEIAEKAAQDAQEAARLLEEMDQLRSKFDADMETLTVELMKDARARAGQEYDRIIGDAEKKADQIIQAAKVKAGQEHDVMMEETKKQVVSVAIDITGLLLGASMDTDKNKALLENYLSGKA
ncbi:MAG: ATP synthase F0 subunit B [Oscillospiraceae bacterium]|nr:ATP synthase F0 subunit B [Oscillospiraceae bacterium]